MTKAAEKEWTGKDGSKEKDGGGLFRLDRPI